LIDKENNIPILIAGNPLNYVTNKTGQVKGNTKRRRINMKIAKVVDMIPSKMGTTGCVEKVNQNSVTIKIIKNSTGVNYTNNKTVINHKNYVILQNY
jgi:uncharacterized protein YkvS